MRRKDREIIDFREIIKILDKNEVCRIAMCDNHRPYIVPINFGYEILDDKVVLYIHCAKEGKKIDMISKNQNVCFEVDSDHKLLKGQTAAEYSYRFESVIGEGKAEILRDKNDKKHGLDVIMRHIANEKDIEYEDSAISAVAVVKITIDNITGKKKSG